MLSWIHNVYNFKVADYSDDDHPIIRLGNLLGILGISITSMYSLFYYLILHSPKVALWNEFFALCYLGYFYFLSRGRLFPALLSIIVPFMANLGFITVFFASSRSGFHYYYLLSGPTLYFFLKRQHKNYRIGFSIAAFVLFLACEIAGDRYSELVLSDVQFQILYFSTIVMVFILLLVIPHTFQIALDAKDKKLENAARQQTLTNARLEKENLERKQAQEALEEEKKKLQDALMEIKTLSGLLPICASCKKIRDDSGYWNQIEIYISDHSDATFSHGICPECKINLYPEYFNPPKD